MLWKKGDIGCRRRKGPFKVSQERFLAPFGTEEFQVDSVALPFAPEAKTGFRTEQKMWWFR